MTFDFQGISETIATQPGDHYGVVRPEFTEFRRGVPTASRIEEVMEAAGSGCEIGRLRREFGSRSKYPQWVLCLAREVYLQQNPKAYRRHDVSALIDENQSPKMADVVSDALGIPCYHLIADKKMQGANDLQVVNCALEHGHSVIVTADKNEPKNASVKPHLTRVVKDLARTMSRAFFMQGHYPDRFHTLPMIVHVPARIRNGNTWEDIADLVETERDTILRHLAGRRTLTLSFSHVVGRKPNVVTHQDIIADTHATFEMERRFGRSVKSADACEDLMWLMQGQGAALPA